MKPNPLSSLNHFTVPVAMARNISARIRHMGEIITGDGYAVGNVDDLGEGPGFRKVRSPLGVTAFGVNAIVLPPGIETGVHFHEHQEELYIVLRGRLEIVLNDGEVQTLEPGGLARVDPSTPRQLRNASDAEVVYICVGGKDGYVGGDGLLPEGETGQPRPVAQ